MFDFQTGMARWNNKALILEVYLFDKPMANFFQSGKTEILQICFVTQIYFAQYLQQPVGNC